MAEIKIILHSDLCAASGAASGNAIDTDVALDSFGVPYIPARRIKGCLRQAAEDLQKWGYAPATRETIEKLFGNADGQAGALTVENAVLPGLEEIHSAIRQAKTNPVLKPVASPARIPDLFTYVRGSTAMENGKAKDGSLRFTRVMDHYSNLDPGQETEFICPVFLSDATCEALLKACCQATRHIGSSRNRGLGDVSFVYGSSTSTARVPNTSETYESDRTYQVEYRLLLREPVVLPGLDDRIASISSRAVIGCLSEAWLNDHSPQDPEFSRLFLSGEAVWQDLTPVADGKRSIPSPRMLARLKGEGLHPINLLLKKTEEDKQSKIKPLDGCFAVCLENGFELINATVSSMYHHSTPKADTDGTLYVEESLDAACVYGGAVTIPGDLVSTVLHLLETANFRFGRSRSAQYGACVLAASPVVTPVEKKCLSTQTDEAVYAILISDLVLCHNGISSPDAASVRKALAAATGLEDQSPMNPHTGLPVPDSCIYRDLGGYHALWQLRKNILTAVRAGSYYAMISPGGELPAEIQLGEYPQEGLGRFWLVSQTEMEKLFVLTEGQMDQAPQSGKISSAMTVSMIVKAAEEAMAQRAVANAKENNQLKNDVPSGRLRLMLAESTDLSDLVMRVQSIKTKDKRVKSLKLLQSLYSDHIPFNDEARTEKDAPLPPLPVSMEALFQGSPTLLNLFSEYPAAEERILLKWKNLLSHVLSLAYYQERKEVD